MLITKTSKRDVTPFFFAAKLSLKLLFGAIFTIGWIYLMKFAFSYVMPNSHQTEIFDFFIWIAIFGAVLIVISPFVLVCWLKFFPPKGYEMERRFEAANGIPQVISLYLEYRRRGLLTAQQFLQRRDLRLGLEGQGQNLLGQFSATIELLTLESSADRAAEAGVPDIVARSARDAAEAGLYAVASSAERVGNVLQSVSVAAEISSSARGKAAIPKGASSFLTNESRKVDSLAAAAKTTRESLADFCVEVSIRREAGSLRSEISDIESQLRKLTQAIAAASNEPD